MIRLNTSCKLHHCSSPTQIHNETEMCSDFSDKINCLPNQRGFKMAFLNIVSLPKRFDEINLTMSNNINDIMSFSETRLNSTITDGMIHIDGYDIIRKDRSRNGGGVCIYLRNSINYQIRQDLIPADLEAICIEITKPHSRLFVVVTVYRPPDASSNFFIHLENLLKRLITKTRKSIYWVILTATFLSLFLTIQLRHLNLYSKFINYPR